MKLMSRKGMVPMRYIIGRVLVIMLRAAGALTVAYSTHATGHGLIISLWVIADNTFEVHALQSNMLLSDMR